MILLATFVSEGGMSETPQITVQQITSPWLRQYADPSNANRAACDSMAKQYAATLVGKLPDGTTLTMSCLAESPEK